MNWKLFRRRARYAFKSRLGLLSEPLDRASRFGIRPLYRHRDNNAFYDDTGGKDQHQREVYEAAAELARNNGYINVFDVGCGSGFKLIKYFSEYQTVGFDLEPTLSFLRSKYPDRVWRAPDFADVGQQADLVICADVVEHIPNPDLLIEYLSKITRSKLVISTPDRIGVYGWDHSGPPRNKAHCREWTMPEFREYVSRWFSIEEHLITNTDDSTQMIVCTPISSSGSGTTHE